MKHDNRQKIKVKLKIYSNLFNNRELNLCKTDVNQKSKALYSYTQRKLY